MGLLPLFIRLFELSEHTLGILGVKEDNGVAMGASLWLLAQSADVLLTQVLDGSLDVVNLKCI